MGTHHTTRQHRAGPLAGIVALVVLAATPALATPTVPQRDLTPSMPASVSAPDQNVQDEYDQVIAEEQELSDQLAAIEARSAQLETELTGIEANLAAAEADQTTAEASQAEAERTARDQAAESRRSRDRVRRTRDLLEEQAVAAYLAGGTGESIAGAILRAESSTDADNAIVYSRAVIGDTDKTVRALEEAEQQEKTATEAARRAETTSREQRVAAQTATETVAATRDEQQRLIDESNQQAALQQAKIDEIQSRKIDLQTRITESIRDSDGVQELLASFQAGQPDYTPGSVLITNPIPGYRIGSKFGMRHHPILNTNRLHAGGDMGAPSGTPIYAPADGIVVFAGPRGGYGNATVISHGNSLGTLYGHQSSIVVKAGDPVTRGDLIGYVGSTGLSTGPHLHFETRIKGVPVDPETIVDFDAPVDYPR